MALKKMRDQKNLKNTGYGSKIKSAIDGNKPLGRPLPNKFLVLLIKDTVLNSEKN